MTINEWIDQFNVRMDAAQIPERTDGCTWETKTDNPVSYWRITLTFEQRYTTFEWTQGSAYRVYCPLTHTVRNALDEAGIDRFSVLADQPLTWQNLKRIAKLGLLDVVSVPVPPLIHDVIELLRSDMDVVESTFTQWAQNMGMDDDSIRAKRAYESTRDLMLRLLHAMGRDAWQALEASTGD